MKRSCKTFFFPNINSKCKFSLKLKTKPLCLSKFLNSKLQKHWNNQKTNQMFLSNTSAHSFLPSRAVWPSKFSTAVSKTNSTGSLDTSSNSSTHSKCFHPLNPSSTRQPSSSRTSGSISNFPRSCGNSRASSSPSAQSTRPPSRPSWT